MRRADHGVRAVDVFLDINAQLVEGGRPQIQGLSNRLNALNRHRLIRSVLEV